MKVASKNQNNKFKKSCEVEINVEYFKLDECCLCEKQNYDKLQEREDDNEKIRNEQKVLTFEYYKFKMSISKIYCFCELRQINTPKPKHHSTLEQLILK